MFLCRLLYLTSPCIVQYFCFHFDFSILVVLIVGDWGTHIDLLDNYFFRAEILSFKRTLPIFPKMWSDPSDGGACPYILLTIIACSYAYTHAAESAIVFGCRCMLANHKIDCVLPCFSSVSLLNNINVLKTCCWAERTFVFFNSPSSTVFFKYAYPVEGTIASIVSLLVTRVCFDSSR